MSFPSNDSNRETEKPALHAEAPAFHIDALLNALEATDKALDPLTSRGMDGRTASILKEIEKSGAIEVRVDGDDLWIDVIDRSRALSVVDRLIASLKA